MIRWIFCFLLTCLIIFSCRDKNKIPGDIVQPKQMQVILFDLLKVDALSDEIAQRDTSKQKLQENVRLQREVFDIHHVRKEDFYKSYQYYLKHKELMSVLLDSVTALANRNRNALPSVIPKLSLRDSIKLIQ